MDFSAITLEIGVLVLALAVMAVDLIVPSKESEKGVFVIAAAGLVLLLAYSFSLYHEGVSKSFMEGMFINDNYAIFFKQLFMAAVLFTFLFSGDYIRRVIRFKGEFYSMTLLGMLGMFILASATDFITAFTGLELMTISFYVLSGARMDSKDSSEAAVKYLIIGAGSTAVMLFGISLVYGATGSVMFLDMTRNLGLLSPIGIVGVTLILIGFFFKLSVIPFHMWAPDVYQGAPTPVTALLAMGSKAAGIAILMRAIYTAFPFLAGYWLPILALFAAICMIGGNIMAIRQKDVKRMLAYSSIAQAGYMMVGMVAADPAGMKGVMFYGMLYVFANAGAFAVLSVVDAQRGGTGHQHVAGLAKSAPLLAAVMTVSLLSMAGIPPTAGFAGKLYLFTAVVEQGYLWLAVIGFVMSMISVYYYLLVVKEMYLKVSESDTGICVSGAVRVSVLISLGLTLLCGVWPEPLSHITGMAASMFMR